MKNWKIKNGKLKCNSGQNSNLKIDYKRLTIVWEENDPKARILTANIAI